MPLTKNNDMVKAVATDRTDQPLRMSVLPWRMWRNRPVPDAHGPKTTDEDLGIDAIPIANDIARCFLPAVGLGELTGDLFGTRIGSHLKPDQFTAAVPYD